MNKWIQTSIKKKGSFRRYVQKKYGDKGFTNGKIKLSIINKEIKNKNRKISKKAILAKTLRKLRKSRKLK